MAPGIMTGCCASVFCKATRAMSVADTKPILPFLPCIIIRRVVLELVMMGPGYNTLIDNPVPASSSLSPNEKEEMNAFDAGYTVLYAIGVNAAMLDTFSI